MSVYIVIEDYHGVLSIVSVWGNESDAITVRDYMTRCAEGTSYSYRIDKREVK